jgi:hypothetical protein
MTYTITLVACGPQSTPQVLLINGSRALATESGIDALSHLALFDDSETRYVSIAGMPTAGQHGTIRSAIQGMPRGSEIVAATDADAAGDRLAAQLKRIFHDSKRADLIFRRDAPEGAKDWNDLLRAHHQGHPLGAERAERIVAGSHAPDPQNS